MEDEFRGVVRRHLMAEGLTEADLSFLDYRTCHDRYVGLIGDLYEKDDYPARDLADDRPANTPCVIMVLESPHKLEYWNVENWEDNPQPEQRLQTPYPANGKTGENIRNLILDHEVFKDISGGSDYGLILLNAIQHQCSLGDAPGEHRDDLFKAGWADFGEGDFDCRLSKVLLDGDIVVNSCTSYPAKLHALVDVAIQRRYPAPDSTHHPVSWDGGSDWCLERRR